MKIRTVLFGLTISSLLLVFTSCIKKDTEIDFTVKSPAKGLVNGKEWTFKSGIVLKTDLFGDISYDLVLIDTIDSDLCDKNYRKNDRLLLSMSKIEEGKYSFKEILNGEEFYGLSFMDADVHKGLFDEGFVSYNGTIEIKEVNREDGLLTGFIETIGDDKNLVKGDFKVRFCVN